jgi:hypothetical protein
MPVRSAMKTSWVKRVFSAALNLRQYTKSHSWQLARTSFLASLIKTRMQGGIRNTVGRNYGVI